VWADKPYDYKSDIWSIGVILYELCTLKPPFKGGDIKELYKSVSKGYYDPLPPTFSKDLNSLVQMLLQLNPKNRPSCEQILSHPIIVKRLNKPYENANLNLMQTIRFPINLSEINNILPKRSISTTATNTNTYINN